MNGQAITDLVGNLERFAFIHLVELLKSVPNQTEINSVVAPCMETIKVNTQILYK
jgi:hypothetical protein